MNDLISLQASDGTRIAAHRFLTFAPARIGVVLIQEVFGVTESLREIAQGYADQGFPVVVPALFDRLQANVQLPEDAEGMRQGREFVGKLGFDGPLRDVRAAADLLLGAGCEQVAVVGFCWGGTLAFLCATRLGLASASYYGRQIPDFLHERPQAPLIFHFGERDEFIPLTTLVAVEAAFPQFPLYRYAAGHAFNRMGQPPFVAESATLAKERTLDFLRSLAGPR